MMRKWLLILLACIAVLSYGDGGVVRQPQPLAVQSVPPGGELTVGRRPQADAMTEYASNPVHIHFGAETAVALQRCPVTEHFGSRCMRYGGLCASAAIALRCRRACRFVAPLPRAVLHPVDHYVYRMRRLLI